MVELTPKQNEILDFIKSKGATSLFEIGIKFGRTKKLAERWAGPAVRILIKHKKVIKNKEGLFEETL